MSPTKYSIELKKGLFEQGIKRNKNEWAKALYGSDDKASVIRLDRLRSSLRNQGFPSVCVPADPRFPGGEQILEPLTKKKDVARVYNERMTRRIIGSMGSFYMNLYAELLEWPEMAEEIVPQLEPMSKHYVSFKKIALARQSSAYETEFARLARGGIHSDERDHA